MGFHSFLKIFLFQYIYILLVAIVSSLVLYYFYLSEIGLGVLNEYVQLSVSELQQYKAVIIEQEGIEYYKMLLNGINGIDAGSIAKDDFSQKLCWHFYPISFSPYILKELTMEKQEDLKVSNSVLALKWGVIGGISSFY